MIYLVKTDNGESYDCRDEINVCYFNSKAEAQDFVARAEEFKAAFQVWNTKRQVYQDQYPKYVQHAPAPVRPNSKMKFSEDHEAIRQYFLDLEEWNKKEQEHFKEYNAKSCQLFMDLGIHHTQAPIYVGQDMWIEEVNCGKGLVP